MDKWITNVDPIATRTDGRKLIGREKMRVAVASKDKGLINQHFGHAERFFIYEVDDKGTRFLEERPVEKYCSGDEEHLYDNKKLERVYKAIRDCSLLLVTRIGPTPKKELEKRGIKTVILYERIEEGIRNAVGGK